MRTSAHIFAFWLLALTTAVLANPFWFRQESTPSPSSASATAAPSSSAAEASASASGTASPAAATTGTSDTAAASTGTANGTAAATSSSSAAATSSVFLPTTPDDLKCENPEDDISPFCLPRKGQIVVVGKTYNVTWDPTLFPPNSTITISVKHANTTSSPSTDFSTSPSLGSSAPLQNEKGYWPMTVHTDYLKEEKENGNGNGNLKNETLLTLFITSNTSSPTDAPIIKSGPVFTLITYNTTSTSTDNKGSGDDKLGEKAGVPVGLGIFLIAAAGLMFWFLRRRRNRQAGYLAKRGQHGGSRARGMMTGDESGAGFRDEPTRGMELQERDRGKGRQDSWEAGWDSASSQGGGGNAFRDEIDRQRRR